MTIDLFSPFWGSLVAGIILLNIAGIWKFTIVALGKKTAEDKISNLISELDSLNKNYKNEITNIKKRHGEELVKVIVCTMDIFAQKIEEILKRNKPPSLGEALISRRQNKKC